MKTNNFQELMKIATLDQMAVLSKVIETFDDDFFYEKIEDIEKNTTNVSDKTVYYVEVFSVYGNLVTSVDLTNFEYIHSPDIRLIPTSTWVDDLTLFLNEMNDKVTK